MIIVSKATRRRAPPDVNQILLRLHAPDPLGFIRDRDIARFGTAEEKARHGGRQAQGSRSNTVSNQRFKWVKFGHSNR